MLKSTDYLKKITYGLSVLSREIEINSTLNLLDLNLHAESFFRDFLNIVFGYNLVNMNTINPNMSSIDLGDASAKIAIQVTSTSEIKKVKDTVDGFIKSGLHTHYNRLVILNIVRKKAHTLKEYGVDNTFKINLKNDIWDYKTLIRIINDKPIEKLKEISDFLDKTLISPEKKAIPKEIKTILAMIELLSDDEHPLAGNGFIEKPDPENKIFKRFRDYSEFLVERYTRLAPLYSEMLKDIRLQSDFGTVKVLKMSAFLETTSDLVLSKCLGNPIAALDELKESYSKKLGEKNIDYDDCAIEFFLVKNLIECTVFPNKWEILN
ncbi:hypothetical protein Rahaq_1183 [Rahnella aceris]|uniref:SMEK domain-containing protein n=1 Tax=Rahnella sp. (strain Y9602) TaxID=2703885 RepID=A0A0H3F6J6_RAHSY|nr:SMEK domain-containing protein [Rahnella aceris]ADW72806.1 hypothetical protein Rahaq_1183 [Rahnella aceris]